MSHIRTFIAFHLPPDVRKLLGNAVAELNRQILNRSIRWVKPELMHITLRFLGDTAETSLPALYDTLDSLAKQHNTLEFELDTLGCFPNCKRPHVVWAGLRGDLKRVSTLKQALDAALQNLGWQPENRPFRPHITIGRVKNKLQLQKLIGNIKLKPLPIQVSKIHLIESNLTPQGPIYTTRHSSQLKN